MPKPCTFPTLYNEVLQLNISKLKDWGYLEPKRIKSGSIDWSRNGKRTASISIIANIRSEKPYIELDYKYKDKPRKYKVYLTSVRSNLNLGEIWYFLCPQTNKRCRKLYSIGGYFLHREAFKGCMYKTQTKSKKSKEFDRFFNFALGTDDLFGNTQKKHFKKTYAGKPTKKYLRIMQKIEQAESITINEFERAMNDFFKL